MSGSPHAPSDDLRSSFGEIDIYLFDQLLKGNFDERRRVLDAGCGYGRNLVFLLRNGFDCYAVDRDPAAVAATRRLARLVVPTLPDDHFRVAAIESLPWDTGSMDAVICSAVLHFVADEEQFARAVDELFRVLAPGGLLFARLASSIGLEGSLSTIRGVVRLPDGSDRFVVDEALLLDTTARLGARLVDPVKTTNVQSVRCMTTWTLEKL